MQDLKNSINFTEQKQFTKPNILKIIIFKLLGFLVGAVLGYLARLFSVFIFIDLLGQVKFLTAILSYPVDYATYALTGVIFADAAASLYPCAFISKFGNSKTNYSCFVLGGIRILSYIITTIISISADGFDFSAVWTIGCAKNEDI